MRRLRRKAPSPQVLSPVAGRCRGVHSTVGESLQLLSGLVGPTLHLGLKSGRLGHLGPQIHDRGGRNGAQTEHEPPRHVAAQAGGQQHQADQGSDDETERLHGEDQADQPAPVLAVGVLAHQHGRYRIVAADTQA